MGMERFPFAVRWLGGTWSAPPPPPSSKRWWIWGRGSVVFQKTRSRTLRAEGGCGNGTLAALGDRQGPSRKDAKMQSRGAGWFVLSKPSPLGRAACVGEFNLGGERMVATNLTMQRPLGGDGERGDLCVLLSVLDPRSHPCLRGARAPPGRIPRPRRICSSLDAGIEHPRGSGTSRGGRLMDPLTQTWIFHRPAGALQPERGREEAKETRSLVTGSRQCWVAAGVPYASLIWIPVP